MAMRKRRISSEVWNEPPGLSRANKISKLLPLHRAVFGWASVATCYTLALGGGFFAVVFCWRLFSGVITNIALTEPFIALTQLAALLVTCTLILLLGFVWTIALTLQWPPEDNRIARALTGN